MGYLGQAPAQAALTSNQIADGVITTAKLSNESVTSIKIADGTVVAADIVDSSITTSKLADGNVIGSKIADLTITTAKLADANVTTTKIADSTITTAKLDSNIVLKGAATMLSGIIETANVIATSVTSNISIDKYSSSVLFYTQNSTSNSNVTVNFTNLVNVPVGNVSSFVVILRNNAEYQSLITDTQVEGNPGNTVSWLSSAPTAGSANLDLYSFSVIKTGLSEYTILANKSNFN